MNKRACVIALMYIGFSLTMVNCGRTACRRLCEWMEKCSDDAPSDCEDECYDDYKDVSDDCQDAMRDLGGCVDGKSCDDVVDDCKSEAEEFLDECEEFAAPPSPSARDDLVEDENSRFDRALRAQIDTLMDQ